MSQRSRSHVKMLVSVLVLLMVAFALTLQLPAEARKKVAKRASHAARSGHAGKSSRGRPASRSGRGSRHERAIVTRGGHHHHGKHHRHDKHHHHHHHVAHRPRYAYPVEMFMMKAPDFDSSLLPEDQCQEIMSAFARGTADKYPARTLVRAGAVRSHALRGGIFWRREPIKYIVMHSTETGIPVSGIRVIESWSSMGRRHPGAQYVVDRDGSIYQAVDPDLATVHINILKTLPGINNDNSIGIEMNHTGSQDYPEAQMASVIRLVTYLQDRYQIESENIITHRYAQQGDHTDPVRFDWKGFLFAKDRHRNDAIASKMNSMESQSRKWGDFTTVDAATSPTPATILQPHSTVVPTQVIQNVVRPLSVTPNPQSTGSYRTPPPDTVTGGSLVPPPKESPIQNRAPITPPVRVPVTPSSGGLDLRGPIEVGPEQAGDLLSPQEAFP
ncbi:MAG: peptidoglycan recognition protein family protein [Candidatus Obscuribacterales bacterium]|nr:peptidoglycan recognition protein family protein [Candidatus Obscuribacterales bacterium]